jgi:hypothetical protein
LEWLNIFGNVPVPCTNRDCVCTVDFEQLGLEKF